MTCVEPRATLCRLIGNPQLPRLDSSTLEMYIDFSRMVSALPASASCGGLGDVGHKVEAGKDMKQSEKGGSRLVDWHVGVDAYFRRPWCAQH